MPEALPGQWRPSGAWDAIAVDGGRSGAGTEPAGVTLQLLDHVDLATIIVRDAGRDLFADAMSNRFALAVPERGRAVIGQRASLIWSAPNQWLAAASEPGILDDLGDALDAIAAVTAQGDGRALVRISGSAARRMLAKCIAIDLHPNVFDSGRTATTAMAHTSVQLWVEDDAPTFVLAATRSMVGTVWRCLATAAAEFGYVALK